MKFKHEDGCIQHMDFKILTEHNIAENLVRHGVGAFCFHVFFEDYMNVSTQNGKSLKIALNEPKNDCIN